MRYLIILVLLLTSVNSYAKCDYSKDITKASDDMWWYSRDCHIEIGMKLDELDNVKKQLSEYDKIVKYGDAEAKLQKQRADMWQSHAKVIDERYQKRLDYQDKIGYIYFGSGVLIPIISAWILGKVVK